MCNLPQPPLGQSQQSSQFELWNQLQMQVCGHQLPHEPQSPQEPQSPHELQLPQESQVEQSDVAPQAGPQPMPQEPPDPHEGPHDGPHWPQQSLPQPPPQECHEQQPPQTESKIAATATEKEYLVIRKSPKNAGNDATSLGLSAGRIGIIEKIVTSGTFALVSQVWYAWRSLRC